jgi:2-iminobutanoate/2-iminopropanoate deaminase
VSSEHEERREAMARTQITNPKLPAPMRGGAYSSGVEAPSGRTVYVSGQVAFDAEGKVIGEGDIKAQTETVLEHVKTVVEEAGGGMEDIVKVTVFITDMGLYDQIHEVRRRYFEEPFPASSMVEVSALIDPRLLIEIEAVAVIQ